MRKMNADGILTTDSFYTPPLASTENLRAGGTDAGITAPAIRRNWHQRNPSLLSVYVPRLPCCTAQRPPRPIWHASRQSTAKRFP